jgi:hypothetical protein
VTNDDYDVVDDDDDDYDDNDVAIPADRNCVQKKAGKKLKYKSLCIEIKRMWNLKCTIIPVIIGATGIVKRDLRKNLEFVPGKHSIVSLQKTAILGTSHIIRKVLQCEAVWSLKPERWGSQRVQEKYQEEKACGKRHPYRIIIIIIIIIIITVFYVSLLSTLPIRTTKYNHSKTVYFYYFYSRTVHI